MKQEPFDWQITVAQKHLADLKQRIRTLPDPEKQGLVSEAIEELSVALEELQIASEELYSQNEELATARHHAETERERYLELFDFAPEGYLTTDLDGRIQEANRAAASLLSISQKFLAGMPLTVFVTEEHLKTFTTRLSLLPTLEHLEDWEIPLQPRDGKSFLAAITITSMPGARGKPSSLRWMINDISVRKRMEEELRQSENRLRSLSERLLTVQEDDRKRVALDLHDSLASTLAAVKFNVEGAVRLLRVDGADNQAVPLLEHALADIQNTFEDVRRIYMDLRPVILDDLGILATLGWFIRDFQKGYSHIRVENKIEIEEREVPARLKIILYRIAHEAFRLLAKHSQSDVIHLSLGRREEGIEMTIRNAANGMTSAQPPDVNLARKEYGYLWMRERVELSGGSFEIESLKGGKTAIRASWPTPRVSSPAGGGIS